jgi:type I restriction enzyme S subunit
MTQADSLKTGQKLKKTEIGEIPVDWKVVKLEDIAAKKKYAIVDGPFGSNLRCSDYVDKGVPVLQGQNITTNRLVWKGIRYITEEKAIQLNRSIVRVGDILITKIGTIGCSAIIDDLHGIDFALIPANLMKVTLDTTLANRIYIWQFLTWQNTKIRIIDLASQTAQPALSLKIMRKMNVYLPPLPEQKKIAEILTTVDDGIEKSEQVIEKTKELKKGLMQQLLTRGIGHTKFKRVIVGLIPVNWEIHKLREYTTTITKGTTPTTYGYQYTEEGVIFLRVENINEHGHILSDNAKYISEETDLILQRSQLKEGDILFSIAGAIGRVGIVRKEILPANTNQALAIIRLRKNTLNRMYLKYVLQSKSVQKQTKTMAVQLAQMNLNLQQVGNIQIPIPPKEEQKRIADVLTTLDEQIEKEQKNKEKLETLKEGLMQVLLTGKVRVKF